MRDNKKVDVPFEIKIISLIGFIYSGFLIYTNIKFLSTIIKDPLFTDSFFNLILSIITIIPYLALNIGLIISSIGLWKGKNWARITIIVISFIVVILGVMNYGYDKTLVNLSLILIGLVIGLYLIFSPRVKRTFT